jgi:aristolochene synthase
LLILPDVLEHQSLREGEAYNERLMEVSEGRVAPDSNDPAQPILHDLWEDMRAVDRELADDVMHHTFTFMRAQTDRARLQMKGLGNYLAYRERDVGKA